MHREVSVIIPAFNALRWLPETLRSVTDQNWPNLQVLVLDDGSTDGTSQFVSERWPHFQLVTTANQGVSATRDLGASLATGDFIQYLDADDLLVPGKIARQVELFDSHVDADVVYGNWRRLVADAAGMFAPRDTVRRRYQDVHHDPQIAFFTDMWCPTGAYLYRRPFHSRLPPWSETLPVIQDARFAFDCAHAGANFIHDDQVATLYRVHSSGSVSTKNRAAFLRDCTTNAEEVEQLWDAENALNAEREAALVKVYGALARGAFDVDATLFERLLKNLIRHDPKYLPESPAVLRCASILFGYRTAEKMSSWFRSIKRSVRV